MFWWTLRRLKSKGWIARREAAEKLGHSGDQRAIGPLIEALKDEASWVRAAAAEALEDLGSQAAVGPLIVALKDDDSETSTTAAAALGRLGSPEAVWPLIEILGRRPSMQHAVAESLPRFGDRAAPILCEGLVKALTEARERPDFEDWDLILAAIKGLEVLHCGEDLLRTALDLPSERIRDAAAEAIVKLISADPRRFHELTAALEGKNESLQLSAVLAAGQKLGSAALEPLAGALKSWSFRVRVAAAEELGKLGEGRAVPALTEALGDTYHYEREKVSWRGATIDDAWDVTEYPVRDAAEEALVSIGGPGAESALAEYRAQREPRARPASGWES